MPIPRHRIPAIGACAILLVRYWTTPKSAAGEPAITECCARLDEKKSVRTDRHKYLVSVPREVVEDHGREYLPGRPSSDELYDLESDSGERRNLLGGASEPEVAELAAAFYRQLRAYLSENPGQAEPTELDDETIRKLESLGYIDE